MLWLPSTLNNPLCPLWSNEAHGWHSVLPLSYIQSLVLPLLHCRRQTGRLMLLLGDYRRSQRTKIAFNKTIVVLSFIYIKPQNPAAPSSEFICLHGRRLWVTAKARIPPSSFSLTSAAWSPPALPSCEQLVLNRLPNLWHFFSLIKIYFLIYWLYFSRAGPDVSGAGRKIPLRTIG